MLTSFNVIKKYCLKYRYPTLFDEEVFASIEWTDNVKSSRKKAAKLGDKETKHNEGQQ